MNAKVILLIVGLAVGALTGYLTLPQAAEVRVGELSIEVQTDQPGGGGGPLTGGQWQHIAIFAAIGAVLGLGLGFAADRRRSV